MLNHLPRPDGLLDPRPVAVTRIVIGTAVFLLGYDMYQVLSAIAPPEVLGAPALRVLPAPSTAWALVLGSSFALAGACISSGISSTFGAALTTVAAVVALLVDQQTYSNHLVLGVLLATFVALARPDGTYSVRHRGVGPPVERWAPLLLQTQLATLYFWAAIAKVNGSYFSGDTLQGSARPFVAELVPDGAWPALAVSMLVLEGLLAFTLWIPRVRVVAAAAGCGMHLGIALFALPPEQLVPFQLLALGVYPLFLWDEVGPALRTWRARARAGP